MGGERQYHWLLSRLGVREALTGGWGAGGEEASGQAGGGASPLRSLRYSGSTRTTPSEEGQRVEQTLPT